MSDDISVRHIEKLDGSNFLTWKFEMLALFRAARVHDVVNGTNVLTLDATAAVKNTWEEKDAKARVLISTTLERSQLISLITCETAKEMWDALCRQYEQKSSSSKLLLLNKFHSYRMESGDTVVQHVSKIKNMALQLKNVGAAMPDDTVMAKILAGLPPSYSNFQTAWDNIDEEKQTIENLTERLVREEARQGTSGDAVEVLAVVKKSGAKKKTVNSKQKEKKDIKCFRCHEKGHYARDCPQKKQSGGGKDKDGSDARKYVLVAEVKKGKSTTREKRVGISGEQAGRLLEVDKADAWIGDSGASRHISHRREWFESLRTGVGGTVMLGNGVECKIEGEGNINLEAFVDGRWNLVRIEKVLYVPEVKKNLLSIGACAKKGCFIGIDNECVTLTLQDEVVMTGINQSNGIYRMFVRVVSPEETTEVNVSTADLRTWHERLGHVGARALEDMVKNDLVTGVKLKNARKFFCEPCQLGKAHKKPFQEQSSPREMKPRECVHTDVCGPIQVKSQGGASYFVTFIDEASSFCHVYFIKHKDEVFEKFKMYDRLVENKFGSRLKTVRSDNGREYKNKKLVAYLEERGINMENSAPHTPQQNGKAERANRTIFESARTMIRAKDLPKVLWAEAVNTAVYVLNRTTHSSRKGIKTAYEEWTGRKPELGHIRVFGSTAYAHIPKQFRKKLDDKAKKLILVGYQDESSNYRLYDAAKRTIIVSRDVVFNETGADESTSASNAEEEELKINRQPECVEVSDGSDDEAAWDDAVQQQQNERIEVQNEQRGGMQNEQRKEAAERQLRDRRLIQRPDRYLCEIDLVEYRAPATYQEAVSGPDKEKWSEAITQELRAHANNETWKVVSKKPSYKLIDSKWVFKVVQGSQMGECRYKARLCARGFMQRQGVDYNETFAPVIRYDSLRAFLANTTQEDYELAQFDVCTAFLYGELKEEIFMKIPEGLVIDGSPDVHQEYVCKLNKSLYGLKQSPRCWNLKFNEFLTKFDFTQGNADHCIFKGCVDGENVFLALFVDDGLVAAKSNKALVVVLNYLKSTFEITVGDASRFVGLQIDRDRVEKTMFIHQTQYTERILEKFGMLNAKKLSVPADPNVVMYPTESEDESENVPYREAVGSLMFLAVVSRPDIAFAVNLVSKYLNKHSRAHWMAVKRIFAYLVGTKSYGILYKSGGNESKLVGYSDADFAGDVETRRSTTGYAFMFANGLISWSSQRQKIVTLSTTESEYVAATAAAREAVWLRNLFEEIGVYCDKPIVIWVDNQSAIKLAKNPEFHKRTKHIDVKFHYVREKVTSREVEIKYVPTKCQRADVFTKALPRTQFHLLCGMLSITST